ncbi:replication-relaxation family protein [Nocardiopsis sp. FR6]|uniref:replication-relaxation family protein n=1 Tax=Nocardiopsis sp. FR6 TaxID=2605986 RepID=UPI00135CCF08|nr:replication-relaxation family protein [Nocardiopsis sp. FR6]
MNSIDARYGLGVDRSQYGHKLVWLAPRVTSRDREIMSGLYEHHVMTTGHIHRLFFSQTGGRRVRKRLLELHQYGLLDRFKPFPGRHIADHWVLAPMGAALVAEHRGVEISELGFRHDRVLAWAHSGRLGHILGLVECLALTTEAARALPSTRLVCWDNERECARQWGRHIRPDAYMRWCQGKAQLDAFWEYDTGSEPLTKVQRKMGGYARLSRESGLPSIVLFAVHSDLREDHLAAKLVGDVSDQVGAYITTHARLAEQGPAEAVWRTTGSLDRLRLIDIALRHPLPEEGEG